MKKILLILLTLFFIFQICLSSPNSVSIQEELEVSIIGSHIPVKTARSESLSFLTPNCLQNPHPLTLTTDIYGFTSAPFTVTSLQEVYIWEPGWMWSWVANWCEAFTDSTFVANFWQSPHTFPNGPTTIAVSDINNTFTSTFKLDENVPNFSSSPPSGELGDTTTVEISMNNVDTTMAPVTNTTPFGLIHPYSGIVVTADDWNMVNRGKNYEVTFTLPQSIPTGNWLMYMIFDWDDFEYNVNTTFTITEPFVSPGDIIISEIMQNPDEVSDANGEWFEVYNKTDDDIDINGWTVHDYGSDSFTISNGGPLIIPPDDYLVLGNNADSGTNGGYTCDYEYTGNFYLANGDDELVLESSSKLIIDVVEWDGGPNWPDPTGASMVFIGDYSDDNNDYNYWTTATMREDSYTGTTGDLGSPGTAGILVYIDEQPSEDNFSSGKLLGSFPNPAKEYTTIKYKLKDNSNSQNAPIKIYNIMGELVKLVNGRNGKVTIDVSDLFSGIYFYKLEGDDFKQAKKLLIMK